MESFRTFSSLELVRANACNRFVSIVHSSGMRQHQIAHWMRNRIPLGCILLCDICRHFASVMLHFASLISHNLRCIPAYSHQIPTGFFKSLLNYHRDTLYIIAFTFVSIGQIGLIRPIGHQLVDSPTCKLVDPLTCWLVDFPLGAQKKVGHSWGCPTWIVIFYWYVSNQID